MQFSTKTKEHFVDTFQGYNYIDVTKGILERNNYVQKTYKIIVNFQRSARFFRKNKIIDFRIEVYRIINQNDRFSKVGFKFKY